MKKLQARHWTADGEYAMRCVTCRDTGYVRSFSPKAMRDAVDHVRGKRSECDVRLSFCDVPCDCSEGDERAVETLRILKKIDASSTVPIRVSDERVIKADPLLRVPEWLAILIEWAREYQSKLDGAAALREAPYAIFEQFNAGVDFAP